MKRILFLLKERFYSQSRTSYGLINSAMHIAHFLEQHNCHCHVVQVTDANAIDKEIHEFRPDIVIIEALWVTAHKLNELMDLKRYHHIKWIVRIHSDIGYLSSEGHALKIINNYIDLHHKNLVISLNNAAFNTALSEVLKYKFTLLPNVITYQNPENDESEEHHQIKIGCFGATRVLKNQCFQAICAIMAANRLHKRLYFHITPNLGITDDSILKNLKELFSRTTHELIVHDWMENHKFQKLIKKMDFGMQLSYTESFNIVASDFISNSKLIIASNAIDWLPGLFRVSTTDYEEVIEKIIHTYEHRNSWILKEMQQMALAHHNKHAEREWLEFLFEEHHHDRTEETPGSPKVS